MVSSNRCPKRAELLDVNINTGTQIINIESSRNIDFDSLCLSQYTPKQFGSNQVYVSLTVWAGKDIWSLIVLTPKMGPLSFVRTLQY